MEREDQEPEIGTWNDFLAAKERMNSAITQSLKCIKIEGVIRIDTTSGGFHGLPNAKKI